MLCLCVCVSVCVSQDVTFVNISAAWTPRRLKISGNVNLTIPDLLKISQSPWTTLAPPGETPPLQHPSITNFSFPGPTKMLHPNMEFSCTQELLKRIISLAI